MALTPRRNEIAAVVSILESDEFDSPEEMARGIVKAVVEELSKRNGYGVGIGLRSDNLRIAHGPMYSILEAKRVVKEAEARGLVAFIAPLLGAASALRDDEEAKAKRCVCGHPQVLHGSAIKPKAVTSIGCGVYLKDKSKCPCRGYDMER